MIGRPRRRGRLPSSRRGPLGDDLRERLELDHGCISCPRSAEFGRRLLQMAEDKGTTRRIVVANKVAGDDDLALIREVIGVDPDLVIPTMPRCGRPTAKGASPVDHAPHSPALGALRHLASSLV